MFFIHENSPVIKNATVLDGKQLHRVDLNLPSTFVSVSGAQLLEFAESIVSRSCFNFALPENLKSAVLHRFRMSDDVYCSFRLMKFDRKGASTFLGIYVFYTADELAADPVVLSIYDGDSLRKFLNDEKIFAMLAKNVFTDLDTENRGKLRKSEIQNALVHIGPKKGVPPISEFPLLSDILKKHEAEGDEELGLSQFAQLLETVLQELADALTRNKVYVVDPNIKVVNGYKLRKLLIDETRLQDIVEKLMKEKHDQKGAKSGRDIIWSYLDKNGMDLGLPPIGPDDDMKVLEKVSSPRSESDFMVLLKLILGKFAELLEATPVHYDI